MQPGENENLIRRFWGLWAARDKAACLALLADDCHYALYVPTEVLPFGGEAHGKAAISDRLRSILDLFYTIRYEGEIVRAQGSIIHGRVDYCFRHKATNEEIDGVLRQVIEVRNGLVVSWREYTDAERVRAFMRLVASVAASAAPATKSEVEGV